MEADETLLSSALVTGAAAAAGAMRALARVLLALLSTVLAEAFDRIDSSHFMAAWQMSRTATSCSCCIFDIVMDDLNASSVSSLHKDFTSGQSALSPICFVPSHASRQAVLHKDWSRLNSAAQRSCCCLLSVLSLCIFPWPMSSCILLCSALSRSFAAARLASIAEVLLTFWPRTKEGAFVSRRYRINRTSAIENNQFSTGKRGMRNHAA